MAVVRKKIDTANRDLKPLGQSCQKKVFASITISLPLNLIFVDLNCFMLPFSEYILACTSHVSFFFFSSVFGKFILYSLIITMSFAC